MQRRVFVAAKRGEFFELLALFAVQPGRHFNDEPREQIAPIACVDIYDPFAAQLEDLAALSSRRHLEIGFALQSGHRDLAAESRDRKRDRDLAVKVVLFALENLMLLDVNDDVEIARRSARCASPCATSEDASVGDSRRSSFESAWCFPAPFSVAALHVSRALPAPRNAAGARPGKSRELKTVAPPQVDR